MASTLNGNGHATNVPAVASRGEAVDALCQTLLRDVDAKVNEKMEEIWLKGRQMMAQAQLQHQQHNEKLAAEIASCQEQQRVLEQQNDQIKQVISDLASRVLGTGFKGSAVCGTSPGGIKSPASVTTNAGGSSNASASPPRSSPEPFSGSEALGPLPEVPAFPFPAQQFPAPLSLAEAIGSDPVLKATPLRLASSLPPTPTIEALPAAGYCPSGGVFSFTLRKADSTELGLNVSSQGSVLLVEGVRAEGAVDAWNRQCVASCSDRAVMRGDRILSVNNIANDPEMMLNECKTRQLLKFTVARANCPLPEVSLIASPAAGRALTSLRADASEFVPKSIVSTTAATE